MVMIYFTYLNECWVSSNQWHNPSYHIDFYAIIFIYSSIYHKFIHPFSRSIFLPFIFSSILFQSIYLPTYQSTYLPIYLSTYLPIYISTNLSKYLPTNLPIYQFIHVPTCTNLSAYLPKFLKSIYQSTSTYLPTYQSI